MMSPIISWSLSISTEEQNRKLWGRCCDRAGTRGSLYIYGKAQSAAQEMTIHLYITVSRLERRLPAEEDNDGTWRTRHVPGRIARFPYYHRVKGECD